MINPLWRQSVMAYIRAEAQPKDKFGHQPRLYALATAIGEDMQYDDDVLFAAAWMHDLGVYIGHRPSNIAELERWNHVPYTIARTRELLSACGFPFEKLDGVTEAIRTHQPFDEPTITEAVILRDADILEQLGAIGALRALAKVGRDTRYPTFSSVLPVLRRAADELPGKLRLPRAQALAEPRVEVLKTLINAITTEAGELLY
ncbi:MAG TPA: HD domain-containing protein [Terracidiphilus sp.]|jgi:uncharacterized protein|nr:HD domain-containing protein [Terracidiphilus sp.]